jgi:hypothetical protein
MLKFRPLGDKTKALVGELAAVVRLKEPCWEAYSEIET